MANPYGKDIKYNNSSLLDSSQSAQKLAADKPVVYSSTSSSESMTIKFETYEADTRSFSLPAPRADLTDDEVKTAADTMIQHGDIFEDELYSVISAVHTTTNKVNYEL